MISRQLPSSSANAAKAPEYSMTADPVALTLHDGSPAVVVIEGQEDEPVFAGRFRLPGVFVQGNELFRDAAVRALKRKVGVSVQPDDLHLVQLYDDPDRDPRKRVVSFSWLVLLSKLGELAPGAGLAKLDVDGRCEVPLALDHAQIVRDAFLRARSLLETTPMATQLLGGAFTIAELRQVYEAFWGAPIDPANFHKRVTWEIQGFIEEVPNRRQRPNSSGGRPAKLYVRGAAEVLDPPLRPRR